MAPYFPPPITSGEFHHRLMIAAGKLPHSPNLRMMFELLNSTEFITGEADRYVDQDGSTLLAYCVGPANEDTLQMMDLLIENGADPRGQNTNGVTIMGWAKAWKRHTQRRHGDAYDSLYDSVINKLTALGADPSDEEPSL